MWQQQHFVCCHTASSVKLDRNNSTPSVVVLCSCAAWQAHGRLAAGHVCLYILNLQCHVWQAALGSQRCCADPQQRMQWIFGCFACRHGAARSWTDAPRQRALELCGGCRSVVCAGLCFCWSHCLVTLRGFEAIVCVMCGEQQVTLRVTLSDLLLNTHHTNFAASKVVMETKLKGPPWPVSDVSGWFWQNNNTSWCVWVGLGLLTSSPLHVVEELR